MHDVLEGHGEHGGYGAGPDMMPATITLSILAVLVAITTLMGHRASNSLLKILFSLAADSGISRLQGLPGFQWPGFATRALTWKPGI